METVPLTPTENAVYELLKANQGKIVTRWMITNCLPGSTKYHQQTRFPDVYIGYLRRKIGRDRIKTIKGFGYILT